ncbi:fibroblast growth factor receptor-like 1 [Montipora capricornis]|uniref:fibroblast growth factor receptor-like 1 n=1 Tax=Montipora capricornis TaxID=246305 RepID=UPI0035F16FF5
MQARQYWWTLVVSFIINAHSDQPGAPPSFINKGYRAWPASHRVRLKCKAVGAPPLHYKWFKDGQRLLSRRKDPYLNSSLWYLKLKNLDLDDAGEYTCIVTNPYGRINYTYVLNVVAKPRSKPILQNGLPRNAIAKVGDNATMECIVLVSGTLPDFRWLKWDKSITSQPKMNNETLKCNGLYKLIDPHYYKFIQVGESYGVQLNINNVDDDDFGLYTCYVSNHIGFAYSSALLMKYEEPSSPSELLDPQLDAVVNNYCGCSKEPIPQCGCCYPYKLEEKEHLVCTNVSFVKDQKALRFTVVLDGEVIVNETLSAINPPPFCQGPKPLAYVCEKYSNMSYGDDNKWGGCLEIYGGVLIKIFDIKLGCFYLPVSQEDTQIMDENSVTQPLADRFKNSFQGSQKEIQHRFGDIFGKKKTKLRHAKKSWIALDKIIFKNRVDD